MRELHLLALLTEFESMMESKSMSKAVVAHDHNDAHMPCPGCQWCAYDRTHGFFKFRNEYYVVSQLVTPERRGVPPADLVFVTSEGDVELWHSGRRAVKPQNWP